LNLAALFCLLGACVETDQAADPCGGACIPGTHCEAGECVANQCATFSFGISSVALPAYSCGAPGPLVSAAMTDINALWGSAVKACVYGPDQPYVQNNAVSHWGTGYVYYDPNFLAGLDYRGSSLLPSATILAHEFGHEIQGWFSGKQMPNIDLELRADCYAGFFLGWVECTGMANATDFFSTFRVLCEANAGGENLPWWHPSAHGTCAERLYAMQNGIYFYRSGQNATVACGLPPKTTTPPDPDPTFGFTCNGVMYSCAYPGYVAGCCAGRAAQCPADSPYFCPFQNICTNSPNGCGGGFVPCQFTGPCGP